MKKYPAKAAFNLWITAIFVLLSLTANAAQQQVVVAASGGDYTTIQDALASIEPTKDNPYVIDVMPGKYRARNVQMKSYVHLRGAGRNVTTISHYSTPATNVLALIGLQDVTITGFTFLGYGSPRGGVFGIGLYINDSANVTVKDNMFDHLSGDIYITAGSNHIIENNIFNDANYGVAMEPGEAIVKNNQFSGITNRGIKSTGSSVITGNIITNSNGVGIYVSGERDAAPVVSGNTITGINGNGIECRSLVDPTATITGNVITKNSGYGAYISACSPILTNNRITGNGRSDIHLNNSIINGSFNVFDRWTWSGFGVMRGGYNVNTAGQPIQ